MNVSDLHSYVQIFPYHIIQVEYHKHVVDQYTRKCQKVYSSLDDDGYVYHNLPYHANESGNFIML